MQYLGDFTEDTTVLNFKFNTRDTDGAPITLAGTPAVAVYVQGSATQRAEAAALTVDYDSITGLHDVTLDLSSDAFYATAKDYQIVLSAGTVDSVSVAGSVLASFSIENRHNAAADAIGTPVALDSGTATIAGMLTKMADDNGGADFDAGTDSLQEMRDASVSAATVADAVWDEASTGHTDAGKAGAQLWTDVDAILDDTGTAGVIVASIANDAITAAAIATGAIDADAIADNAIDAGSIATGAIDADAIADNAIDAGAIATGAITAAKFAAGAIDAAAVATGAIDADALAADAITAAKVAADVGTEIAAAVGALAIEGSVTLKQSLQLSNAASAGKVDGAGTATVHLRDLADSKNRVTATVDDDGNRSDVWPSYD